MVIIWAFYTALSIMSSIGEGICSTTVFAASTAAYIMASYVYYVLELDIGIVDYCYAAAAYRFF